MVKSKTINKYLPLKCPVHIKKIGLTYVRPINIIDTIFYYYSALYGRIAI